MIRFLFLLFVLSAIPAQADTPLRKLRHADEARKWVAVGRVNIGRDGFCTGTLIEANIVLTAAHCFFDPRTRKRVADSKVRFVAGWSSGSANSIRGARKVAIDPDYTYSPHPTNQQITNDLALIELDQPINDSIVKPFKRARSPRSGASVAIVSYAQGRSEIPSIQERCSVLVRHQSVMALSCDINFGASGSPIFDMSGPLPRVVSVVSAKGFLFGRRAAFTMSIDSKVDVLMKGLSVGTAKRKTSGQSNVSLSEKLGRSGKSNTSLPQISGN